MNKYYAISESIQVYIILKGASVLFVLIKVRRNNEFL